MNKIKKFQIIVSIFGIMVLASIGDYVDYRNWLINKHGYEEYILMNENAGIGNEIQSYIYYMQYGE